MLTNSDKYRISKSYCERKEELKENIIASRVWLSNHLNVPPESIIVLGIGNNGIAFNVNTPEHEGFVYKLTSDDREFEVAHWAEEEKPHFMAEILSVELMFHNVVEAKYYYLIKQEKVSTRWTKRLAEGWHKLDEKISDNTNLVDCHDSNVGVNSKGQIVAFDLRTNKFSDSPYPTIYHNFEAVV